MRKYFSILALFICQISFAQSNYVYRKPWLNFQKAYEHIGKREIEAGLEYFDKINPSDSLYDFAQFNKIVTSFAGELYSKTIETCNEAIETESSYEADAYFYKIKSLIATKEFGKADQVIKEAFENFPLMFVYDYLRAEMLFEKKELDAAKQLLESIVISHPQHSESHALLANIYAKQSAETEAILAYQMAIISNRNSGALRKSFIEMEDVMKDNFEVTNEKKDHKSFKQLNSLVNAKMAVQNNYKASMAIRNYSNNVTDLIFKQFTFDENSTYFPMKYYGKLIHKVKEAGLEKGYILYMLEVLNNPSVIKYQNKYRHQMDAFEKGLFKFFKDQVNQNKFPVNGEVLDRDYILNEKGRLIGVGSMDENNKSTGNVTYFYPDGKVSADLNYNAEGKLDGKSVWYDSDGLIKETGEYENGKINGVGSYAKRNGVMVYEGEFKEGTLNGEAKIYYPNGSLHFLKNFKDKKTNGPVREFYSFGKLLASFSVVDDQIEGLYASFYPDEDTLVSQNYIDGKEEGKHIEYHPNGKIAVKGAFKQGLRIGKWSDYYYSGNLKATYQYKSGKLNGTYIEFSALGDTLVKSEYVNDLKHGAHHDYGQNNTLLWTHYYKKGKYKKVVSYNSNGSVLREGKKDYVLNDRYGFDYIRATRKGNIFVGEYKVYWKSGGIKEHWLYDKKGLLNGYSITYFENGKKDESMYYLNGKLHGEYFSYYDNGEVFMEGFYSHGKEVGEWKKYHPNGELQRTMYYDKGERIGHDLYYDLNGVKTSDYETKGGMIYKTRIFDTSGKIVCAIKTPAGSGDYNLKNTEGNKYIEGELVNGEYNGERKKFYPNGQLKEVSQMVFGKIHGAFKSFYPNGQVKQEGTLEYGAKQGVWKNYHHNGNLSWEGNYENDLVRDSVRKYYLTGELSEVVYYNKEGDLISEKNYHQNGQLMSHIPYDRDFIHGSYSNYDPFGEVLINRKFNGGIEVGYSYQKDGKLIEMIPMQAFNEVKAYFNNGKPSFSYTYEKGLYTGEYKRFYSNGNKWIEANYEKDDNQGERKSYYTNGNLRRVANYKDGRLNGSFKYYNQDGLLLLEETYLVGNREGIAKYYDNNGKLLYTLTYRDDVVVKVE